MTLKNLEEELRKGKWPGTSIVAGSSADKRMKAALLIAQAAVCTGNRPLCGKCRNCMKVKKKIHPDITTVSRDEDEKEIVVAKIRALRRDVFMRPNEAERSVVIIADADTMNSQAQNALLKILEEPPEYASFVLLADNSERLLPTVRSRCVILNLTEDAAADAKKFTDRANKLLNAYLAHNNRQLMEVIIPFDKLKRPELLDLILCIRRTALKNTARFNDTSELARLLDAMDNAEMYMNYNVSAGHITGMLLASLCSGLR